MSWVKGMHPFTRELWQRLHAAGPDGMLRSELRAAYPDRDDIAGRLGNLVTLNYARQVGKYKDARFIATGKVPSTPAAGASAEDPEAQLKAEALAKTPQGVPPGVPNSVFDLGRTLCGIDLQRAAEVAEPEAAPTAAPAAAAPPAAGPWSMPPLEIPTLKPLREQLQARQPAEHDRSMGGPVRKAPTPRFELHSEGSLLIDPSGDGVEPITLTPTVTRHLFRWLDCIGGLQLNRLVPADSTEATS